MPDATPKSTPPSRLARYFGLERAVFGASGVERDVILFTGVLAGTVGSWLIGVTQSGNLELGKLVAGGVAAVVVFPQIYYTAGLDKAKPNFVKWCVAFQNGYFWPTIMEQVGSAVGGAPPA